MPLTEDEFRALLVERSAETPAGPDRLAGVRRRVARRRRAQAALAAVAVLAAGAGAAVPLLAGGGRHPAPVIHRPAPVVHHEPTAPPYANGGKLLASATLHSPQQGAVTFTFVPTDWRLTIWDDFATAWPETTDLVTRVNGHLLFRGGSGGPGTLSAIKGGERKFWSRYGVRLGQPSAVTVTVLRKDFRQSHPPVPLPAAERPTGTGVVAIYQGVPLAEYPLPSPPAELLRFKPVYGALDVLDSRKVGPTGRWTLPVTVGRDFQVVLQTVAPGEVRLFVDGHLVTDDDSWDFRHSGVGLGVDLHPGMLRYYGLHVREGQRATLTVEASRFTVPGWRVVVQDITR